jgi:hypothetical protein
LQISQRQQGPWMVLHPPPPVGCHKVLAQLSVLNPPTTPCSLTHSVRHCRTGQHVASTSRPSLAVFRFIASPLSNQSQFIRRRVLRYTPPLTLAQIGPGVATWHLSAMASLTPHIANNWAYTSARCQCRLPVAAAAAQQRSDAHSLAQRRPLRVGPAPCNSSSASTWLGMQRAARDVVANAAAKATAGKGFGAPKAGAAAKVPTKCPCGSGKTYEVRRTQLEDRPALVPQTAVTLVQRATGAGQ